MNTKSQPTMKIFDIVLFVSLMGIAVVQFALDLIGFYGMIALITIAILGLVPTRIILTRKLRVKPLLQRITGKTQR